MEPSARAQSFLNWETPQVHPLDITPDGYKLLACNTADNRLEVFTLTASGPVKAGSVPVGLDPVSVRARTSTEVWVVNHISDSISVVDLTTMNVRATIATGDEPCDVVFAGKPSRAFVSVSQLNQVRVFDSATLAQIGQPIVIEGEDPRAMATDGSSVYVAIFDSGNKTTVLSQQVVSSTVNPYGNDANPPPNSGNAFVPAITAPNPPAVGLIVRKVGANWVDDNTQAGLNWNAAVTWDLHDHDVAVINAASLGVTYITGVMNLNMGLGLRPGAPPTLTVIGTEALNHKRFEPNARGVFVRVLGANVPVGGGSPAMVDLNPHLNYSTPTVPQGQRDLSIGDPRGIDWRADGQRAYIAGLGSNNVIVTNAALGRVANIDVGQGPTAVRFDQLRGLVYVLNRFAGTISSISDATLSVQNTVAMFDPTPLIIRVGRPHLYNTHRTSGLGHLSCASCHVDARMDQLAWDLGDPQGAVVPVPDNICQVPVGGFCGVFHPMKGPMVTQTLIGILNTGVLHWRGDRANLAAFNPAFVGLLGDDTQLTAQEMNEFTNFIATIRLSPQPNRNFDNTVINALMPNGGNPAAGQSFFLTAPVDGGLTSTTCHQVPTGTNGLLTPAQALQQTQSIKVPQLRNMYEKTGFFKTGPGAMNNNRGFGFIHDGSTDTLFEFLHFPGFNFPGGDQQRRDVEAFLLSFPSDTHAAVGVQTTVLDGAAVPAPQQALINDMLAQANTLSVGLVVKGRSAGLQRGWSYAGAGMFQSDRAAETASLAGLTALASPGDELTLTVVPNGSQTRIGIDRDSDGFFDRDELDACSDPADPAETPNNVCLADTNASHAVDVDDLIAVILTWGTTGMPGTIPTDVAPGCGNGVVDVDDLIAIILAWGACP